MTKEESMNVKLLKAVKAARILLSEPEHWVRKSMAVDAEGRITACSEPDAVGFCLLGALYRGGNIYLSFLNPIRHLLPEWAVSGPAEHSPTNRRQFVIFNADEPTTQADVLDFLDRAIRYLESNIKREAV